MNLFFSNTDINFLLSRAFDELKHLAEEKHIRYTLSLPKISLTACVDRDALRCVLTGLLQEAVLEALHGVQVSLLPFNSDDHCFSIAIRHGSTWHGEGLAGMAGRERLLVAAQQAGATSLSCPADRADAYLDFLMQDTDNGGLLLAIPMHPEQKRAAKDATPPKGKVAHSTPEDANKPLLLLVDPDREVLAYLNKELKMDHRILRASNGAEAMELLAANEVQLILTEIDMPVMDGISLCQLVKSDRLLSHIPVLFLTSLHSKELQIKALMSGADAYMEKPISLPYLMAQLDNLLRNRQMVRNHVSDAMRGADGKRDAAAAEDFIGELHAIIYENISDMELTVDELAKRVNMSRPTLYRKVKTYSHLTPHEMIGLAKLNKAAELLAQKKYSITQVATMVGYSVQSNFSRDFHKHFGTPPSIYSMNRATRNDVA